MISPVEKMAFALIYAVDLQKTVSFYEKYFGFKIDQSMKLSDSEVYGHMGPVGIWIGGGYKKNHHSENDIRVTVMLRVKSAQELFSSLQKDEVKLYQKAPVQMKENSWWFQLADNSGNIIDILGGK